MAAPAPTAGFINPARLAMISGGAPPPPQFASAPQYPQYNQAPTSQQQYGQSDPHPQQQYQQPQYPPTYDQQQHPPQSMQSNPYAMGPPQGYDSYGPPPGQYQQPPHQHQQQQQHGPPGGYGNDRGGYGGRDEKGRGRGGHEDRGGRDRGFVRRERSPDPLSKEERQARRRRKGSNWDRKPTHEETMHFLAMGAGGNAASGTLTPAQILAQAQGRLPLPPGTTLQMRQGGAAAGGINANTKNQMMASLSHDEKQIRRVYVGNVLSHIGENELRAFMTDSILTFHQRPKELEKEGRDPVFSVSIKADKMFAFVEFYNPIDADIACSMDGISLLGCPLKIRRPKDYMETKSHKPKVYDMPGLISLHVENGPHKIFLGNLPPTLNEGELKELVGQFGPLKSFNLVRDTTTGFSKGYAFCAFINTDLTDLCCSHLNLMQIGDRQICVQRANKGINAAFNQDLNDNPFVNSQQSGGIPGLLAGAGGQGAGMAMAGGQPTRILVLLNMVTAEELATDYNDIILDVKEECEKFGQVLNVLGKGNKLYVEYIDIPTAARAQQALEGRKFAQRTVLTSFLTEEQYLSRQF